MKQFSTIQKLDQAILYGLEMASSVSVVLLSIGVVASMSNTLTDGWLLGSSITISRAWIISQTIAMDTGLIVSIVRAFVLAKHKHYLQCSLYTVLSILLLSTTAIVSNIESIQQTLGITLEKAYTYSPIPLAWLVSMRSLCVVLLIVAHALKYVVAADVVDHTVKEIAIPTNELEDSNVFASDNGADIVITEQEDKQKALPEPKKRTANTENLERVRAYMADHQGASVREIASALSLGISTANKWMRRVSSEQTGAYTNE